MGKIKVIAKEVGKKAEIKEMDGTYEALRGFIGDGIEFSDYPDRENVCFITDEEYLLKDLPATVMVKEYDNILAGNCLVVALDEEGDTVSLGNEQAEELLKDFRRREFNDPSISISEAYDAMQRRRVFVPMKRKCEKEVLRWKIQ